MRPFSFTMDLANVDADGIADNNDSSGATLTLDGALTSGGTFTSSDGLARRISIKDTATQDQSDSVFYITGTTADDEAQVEGRAGPGSGATVESVLYFKTITSITISGGDANDKVDVGTVDEAMSKTYMLDFRAKNAATYAMTEPTGSAVGWDVEECFQDLAAVEGGYTLASQRWFSLSSHTASAAAVGTLNATNMRVRVTSHGASDEITIDVTQGASGR